MKKNNKKKKNKFAMTRFGAVIFAIVFLAGIFFFGPKVQGFISGKLMAKGNFYFNGGAYDLNKAAKYYKVASFVDLKASYPHYQLARVALMKTEYKNGLGEIDRALALNPENKRAYYIRGLIDGYAKNYKAAQEDFQKFIEWAPQEWAGYNDLAWAYYQDKNYQKAADAAQKGLEVVPNNAWLLNGLGVSLQAMGESEKAKNALDQSAALAKNMTPVDWKKAYPGNEAQTAEWDLAQFKTDVNYNLGLASAYNIPSDKGKFQAACGSSTVNACSGTSCISIACDPDHADHGVPICGGFTPCTTDCDCGATPIWGPWSCGTPPASCNTYGSYNCQTGSADTSSAGSCVMALGIGRQIIDNGTCCSKRVSNCGAIECRNMQPCPVNHNPTVTISSPANGSTNVPVSTNFAVSIADQDAGDALSYTQTLTCAGSPQTINNPASGSGTSPINLSFTQSLPAASSCTWTINASDNHSGAASGQSTFNVVGAPPSTPSCACGTIGGQSFCANRQPTTAELCSQGTPSPTSFDLEVFELSWTCSGGGCTGTASCSARGRRSCGWIETNP